MCGLLTAKARWRMPGRERRYKKSIRISSNGCELQIPKKGMMIDA
jgi:hypothetical protein